MVWRRYEGVQAGLGAVTQINDEEAAALAGAQEAALEDSRWREEMALKRLQAERGGVDGAPSKIEEIMMLTDILLKENPGMPWAEASAMAREQAYRVDPFAAQVAEQMKRNMTGAY